MAGMMSWLKNNSRALQSISAILTVLLALAALFGIKIQLDGSAAIQREQSAKDIYREFLNLSIQNPELAMPDYCELKDGLPAAKYENFVGYMLYTSEQVLDIDNSWKPVVGELFKTHSAIICDIDNLAEYSLSVSKLISTHQSSQCNSRPTC